MDEVWSLIGEGASEGAIKAVVDAWWKLARYVPESDKRKAMDAAVGSLGSLGDGLRQMDDVGRHLERQAKLVKTAMESNLGDLMAKQFMLEVGLAQRAIATACEMHLPTPEARRAFMTDVQRALAEITARTDAR